uniref:Uncharacterized protein n=1 Tax=Anguilla anguilla TaxID=7936 RepID=A0A0E9TEG8_ANGAN
MSILKAGHDSPSLKIRSKRNDLSTDRPSTSARPSSSRLRVAIMLSKMFQPKT